MDWKKIWHFIWEEDSLASWIVNVILAFVIIKFILYPVLGFILGTSYPIVAVVSSSMEHDLVRSPYGGYYICDNSFSEKTDVEFWEECGGWYENRNISQEEFNDYVFKNGFNKGDIIILKSKKNIEKGDVIVFWSNKKYPIIHRVVDLNETTYITKGDHNARADSPVQEENVLGKALFRIPFLGWIKIWFVEIIQAVI